MTAQELATSLLQMLPEVRMPLTPQNLNAGAKLYDTLGKMARGELILAQPPKD